MLDTQTSLLHRFLLYQESPYGNPDLGPIIVIIIQFPYFAFKALGLSIHTLKTDFLLAFFLGLGV